MIVFSQPHSNAAKSLQVSVLSASDKSNQFSRFSKTSIFCCFQTEVLEVEVANCSDIFPASFLQAPIGPPKLELFEEPKAVEKEGVLASALRMSGAFELPAAAPDLTFRRPFFCSVCSKEFVRKDVLMAHLKTHTGEKPHVCPICHKAFNRKFNLKTHRRVHTGERPFNCRFCPRAFSHKKDQVKHERVCFTSPASLRFGRRIGDLQASECATGDQPVAQVDAVGQAVVLEDDVSSYDPKPLPQRCAPFPFWTENSATEKCFSKAASEV